MPATTKSDPMKRCTSSPSPALPPIGTPLSHSPEYESGTTVRRVRTNGEIKWQGQMVYLSEALCGEPVGLTPQDDRFWTIRYGPLQIGLLDSHANRTLHTPTLVLPMSPVYV